MEEVNCKEFLQPEVKSQDSTSGSNGSQGICTLLRTDKRYRSKFWETVWLGWSLFLLGWIFGQTGPSFLDILAITNTDIEQGSSYVTTNFVGYLVGALCGGFLYDRLNRQMLLFVNIFLCGVVAAVIPWCYIYGTMIASQTVYGLLQGAWDAIANAHLIFIWGPENGPYMQAIQFAFAVGGIISPLATAPYLLPITDDKSNNNNSYSINATENVTFSQQVELVTFSPQMELVTFSRQSEFQTSRLYIAYSITAALCLSSAAPFLVLYFQKRNPTRTQKQNDESEEENEQKISTCLKCVTLTNILSILGIFGVLESMAVQYIPAFCTTYLNWNKNDGSTLMSLYWVTFGIGRFSGIFLIKYIHFVKILMFFEVFLILDSAAFLLSSMYNFHVGVWIFGALVGFALSIIFPVLITWTENEMFRVTGIIAALFLLGGSSLRMLNPLLLGYLMDEVSPMYFCYLLIGYSFVSLALCFLLYCLSRTLRKTPRYTNKETYISVPLEKVA